ncbi:hypothetical protein G3I15_11065, partial [Streptomyces sp. SID10244]|nr:hypothetical protein [Streptomyces sp. SID10244]
ELRGTVEHARLFSLAINGAALIYNLLIAERFETFSADDSRADEYRERLSEWADDVEADRAELTSWNID